MTAVSRIYQRILASGAGLMMALVFAIIFVNSLRRYTTGKSFSWGEELPIYLTVYGVMFGIGLAYLQDRHIRFTLLTDIISPLSRKWFFTAMDAATLVTGLTLTWSGLAFAMRRPQIEASGLISAARQLAESTGFLWLEWLGRMGSWQSAIAFGGIILALAALVRLLVRLQEA